MKKSIWTRPIHPFRAIGHALVWILRHIWTAFNAVIVWFADDTHWTGVRRLLVIPILVLLLLAVRYGWLANAKLDWLAALFAPLLGKEYPWMVP